MTRPLSPRRTFTAALPAAGMAVLALLAAGCASQPDRYYTLAPATTGAAAAAAAVPPLFLDLAPVAVPERLARPQMLVRADAAGAQVRLLEQHRWSASFEKELRDALAAGIVARSGAIDVSRLARPSGQPAWRVAVQLQDFDAVEGRQVEAAFGWTLRRSDAGSGLYCRWQAAEPAAAGIDALAAAAQRVTARAADALSRQLLALRADGSAGCLPS